MLCKSRPWTGAAYQASSTPTALAQLVLSCLELMDPTSYRHDEVGLVALNSYPWFQNINEFGLTSTVQQQLAALGMPPLALEDGPGGIIAHAVPSPTQLPNDLALGATFDTSLAGAYGDTLGAQAHDMGYDAVQAPDLNLLRIPTWGRAFESFGESPVLAGEMAAAEAVAIESQHVIPILKHFGPYSQDTDRRGLNQIVSDKALWELYLRPFTFALNAVTPQLHAGGHAVGIMCSYGNLNGLKACRSPLVSDELNDVGVNALVRSDLDVQVNPSALVLNGVDLIKPMDTGELVRALRQPAVDSALTQSVLEIFETEFADGLVNGSDTAAVGHRLTAADVSAGSATAEAIEERAAVLLKDDGVLPLTRSDQGIAVVTDGTLDGTCLNLAGSLTRALQIQARCVNVSRESLPHTRLFPSLPGSYRTVTRTERYAAGATGAYVVQVTTLGNTEMWMDGTQILDTQGLAENEVQRTAAVSLTAGTPVTFQLSYRGKPPKVVITRYTQEVQAAASAARGAAAAIYLGYDLAQEGMDRDTIDLPNAQDAIIEAMASQAPTVAMLGTSGPVAMPWLSQVAAVLEVWSPMGAVQPDRTLDHFVPAFTNLLDGNADPSGRLPVTFPVSTAESPAGVPAFWPGIGTNVNLDLAPYDGVGIGMAWYRRAGWPVLFPFGYGLSYTTYAITSAQLQSNAGGIALEVAVKDTGSMGGSEPIQVYADFPSSTGEPPQQLVGFGIANFSRAQASGSAIVHLTIPISPDAYTVNEDVGNDVGRMRAVSGTYCLEVGTYDGDPRALSTGQIQLSNGAGNVLTGANQSLSPGSCPGA